MRHFIVLALIVLASLVVTTAATATIHPIVESFECANEQAFANHPLGDPADPPGQTPGATPGNGQNVLRAIEETSGRNPNFGSGVDGQCGKVGQ
jgi:hypothetical protein